MSEPYSVTSLERGSDADAFQLHELTQNVVFSRQKARDAERRLLACMGAHLELDLARQGDEAHGQIESLSRRKVQPTLVSVTRDPRRAGTGQPADDLVADLLGVGVEVQQDTSGYACPG